MSESPVFFGDGADPQLTVASERARQTFKFFWRELSWEYRRIVPGLDMYAVKVGFPVKKRFLRSAPESEVMWISDIDFNGHTISGTLLNKPQWVKGMREGSPVTIPTHELVDWMYAINGKVYGGYTVQALRSAMSPAERAQHDAAWGMDFGDPGHVLLAPRPVREDDGSIGTDDTRPVTEPAKLESTEHPMSVNMKQSAIEMLDQQPEMVNAQDDDGWSILHRESLAGNATSVQVLLKKGAVRTQKNGAGETAMDLAVKMGWPVVIKLLSS